MDDHRPNKRIKTEANPQINDIPIILDPAVKSSLLLRRIPKKISKT